MRASAEIHALTGLRGIAAWWVVLYHFRERIGGHPESLLQDLLGGGYIAVDLFFILSGFVIHTAYGNHFARLSWSETRKFILMRLGRVYPAHFVILVLYLSAPLAIYLRHGALDTSGDYAPEYFLLSLFLAQNWGFTDALQWNVPAWSISTEIVSYAAFPFLALLMSRWINSRLSASIFLVSAIALVAAVFSSAGANSLGSNITSLGLTRCVLEFTVGVALSAVHRQGIDIRIAPFLFPLSIGTIATGLGLGLVDYYFFPVAAALMILGLVNQRRSTVNRLLETRVVHYLGVISYSTYIAHYLVKRWVLFVFARDGVPEFITVSAYITGTLIASILLFKLVEDPMRQVTRTYINREHRGPKHSPQYP